MPEILFTRLGIALTIHPSIQTMEEVDTLYLIMVVYALFHNRIEFPRKGLRLVRGE